MNIYDFKTVKDFENFQAGFESWEDAKKKLAESLNFSTEGEQITDIVEIAPGLMAAVLPDPRIFLAIVKAAESAMERFGVGCFEVSECGRDICTKTTLGAAAELILICEGNWTDIKSKIAIYLNLLVVSGHINRLHAIFEMLQATKFMLKEFCDYRRKKYNNGRQ